MPRGHPAAAIRDLLSHLTAIGGVSGVCLKAGALPLLLVAMMAFGETANTGRNANDWAAYGGAPNENHFSSLTEVNDRSVARLGLVREVSLGRAPNGATVPLAVDGVVYVTIGQSIVSAIDVSTGHILWRFDPESWKFAPHKHRLGWGARGLAFAAGRIFLGTTDGRLIAINAKTGTPLWQTQTVSADDTRFITGAPRVYRNYVIIGHAGADIGATRGYVTAYDVSTGRQIWRFFTVPGDPALGFENAAMAMAAKTWSGHWWDFGGGGTVWDAITFDPELNLVYIGVGNGSPWNRKIRSPEGGDNLFLCSIVALDADTGEYRWHYQTTPGESWDFTSTMDIELTTLVIDGKQRKVILHAPKNGFFYVIDRTDGKLISAAPFAKVTWASHVDTLSGRPIETPGARYEQSPATIWPGGIGAHSWHSMSFNPAVGLAYIPTQDVPGYYSDSSVDRTNWRPRFPGGLSTGLDDFLGVPKAPELSSALVAWDPVAQRERWRVATPSILNGGTLTTAGNLVFQGQIDGWFKAYAADSGRSVWSFDTKMGIGGTPISFAAAGRQYIAVVAGWGGSLAATNGALAPNLSWRAETKTHRLLMFGLDGKTQMQPLPPNGTFSPLDDPSIRTDPDAIKAGALLYFRNCMICHGLAAIAGGYAPDLRASRIRADMPAFDGVVRGGALRELGMPAFEEFAPSDLLALRQYLTSRAREDLAERHEPTP